ncbi:hypothetical protein [Brevundimonas sp.]|uniref:hypothetical protein n=1 Tax=Brevundimonas sp. TaxID=1871086 RepID=UPI003F72BA31
MLDQETAERAIEDLGSLVNQVIAVAATQPVALKGEHRWIGITNLVSAGQDIAVLASAIGVLARRSEVYPPQAERYPRGL